MLQGYILVRLKRDTPHAYVGKRRIGHHSQFGNLHAVESAAALRLCEAGTAKLLPHNSLSRLRRQVQAAQAQRNAVAATALP